MPIYEYICDDCKDVQEIFIPYEQVSLCKCGGQMKRVYLTPPAVKMNTLKGGYYKTQSLDKTTGESVVCTTKHQLSEFGKKNGVIIEYD
ncbi:MAG: hypothetical protein CO162_02670 [bacterium (Candidatus Ratteibacteria) CG_4_9_14_3_um_filter_41_21]|uniref:Putative regulatory protein FmdB zinc ribbon domain-containing protein n=1 Tax=bacterium (Candidatus Ratteibacteria) CG_4_9_14_3_um_filter_41_21 TaxID=2014289 RepID=A0A2M7YGM3_9BACT|nr:MAG: hypothetical protein CO162_02670 [bacterium (Candidatus Ratteibacteria) CG_4_9_14_3_um_filter_41_21]